MCLMFRLCVLISFGTAQVAVESGLEGETKTRVEQQIGTCPGNYQTASDTR